MKNCLNGYLTKECANCPYWYNGADKDGNFAVGCGTPFPIDHCSAFHEMYEQEQSDKQNCVFETNH